MRISSFRHFSSRVRGTHDHYSDDEPIREAIRSIFVSTVRSHGYVRVETPVLELASLFSRTLGDASDVVSKEMYSFSSPKSNIAGINDNDSDSLLCLRPEGTAGIMRSLISSGRLKRSLHPYSQRYYYDGPMFRHERPQKGRFREFSQLGVELIGGKSSQSDCEAIALANSFLSSLLFVDSKPSSNLKSNVTLNLCINTIGDDEGRKKYSIALRSYLNEHRERLSLESQSRLERGRHEQDAPVFRILDSKSTADQEVLSNSETPRLEDYLSDQSRRRFEDVLYNIHELGINPTIDPRLVRGLDYYSDTVFEFVVGSSSSDGSGHLGTVLAGGRYDRLSKILGNSDPVPSIGWAAGLERLSILLSSPNLHDSSGLAAKLKEKQGPMRIAILSILPQNGQNKSVEATGLRLSMLLPSLLHQQQGGRREAGVNFTVIRLEPDTKLSKLLSSAAAAKADVALILGETELERGLISVKNLATAAQESLLLPWLDSSSSLVNKLINQTTNIT
jgi:histidyl-tRNA synthetase